MSNMLRQKNNEIRRERGDFLFLMKRKLTSKKEIARLAEIYVASYNFFDSLTPCTQFYSRGEIEKIIKDKEVIKYLIYHKGLLIGFGIATTNLRKVPWINFNFYWKTFPEQMKENAVFYFKGISISPEFQDISIEIRGEKKVKVISEFFNFILSTFPIGSILAFDCSEKANFWLCSAMMSSTGCFSVPEKQAIVDKQIYHALLKTKDVKNLFKEWSR